MKIETRLENLEKLVCSFIESQTRTDDYKTADIKGCRQTNLEQQTSIDTNISDISDTMEGLTETFEKTSTNTDDISICMNAITEIYEQIGGW